MKSQRAIKRSSNQAIKLSSYRVLTDMLCVNEQGLIPTIIQDEKTKKVLTLCYLNRDALTRSLTEGKVYVFRRSQNRLMLKGETSGHIQRIQAVHVDCEGKSLLLIVRQHVAGCHAGYLSCYFRRLAPTGRLAISDRRVFDPKTGYRSKT